MKTTEKYEAPLVEVIEVAVEKGFAGSPTVISDVYTSDDNMSTTGGSFGW